MADRIGIDQQAIEELTTKLNTVLENFNAEKAHFMDSIQETVNTPAFEGASAAAVAEFSSDLDNAYAGINLEFETMIQDIINAAAAITAIVIMTTNTAFMSRIVVSSFHIRVL